MTPNERSFVQIIFEDQSVDLYITQDVFEHILDLAQAFREIVRSSPAGH